VKSSEPQIFAAKEPQLYVILLVVYLASSRQFSLSLSLSLAFSAPSQYRRILNDPGKAPPSYFTLVINLF